MRRREFLGLVSGAAAWPVAARAQQADRVRRIGVLMSLAADDPEGRARFTAFMEGLRQAGWTDGRNVRVETRWTAGKPDELRKYAGELVGLAPDVFLATTSHSVEALQSLTRSIPIVFAHAVDPVGGGFVESLSRPGGNVTGFTPFEYSISAKWLELLKEIAPQISRVGVLRESAIGAGTGQLGAIQSVAPSLHVELTPININNPSDIERSLVAFARIGNGGLVVTASPLVALHRNLILALAQEHKLPAIYYEHLYVTSGGLISYGPDLVDLYRRAASYVDRILKGERPADLPVQAPTKYELAINLRTAKAIGLEVPATLLARADEVIE